MKTLVLAAALLIATGAAAQDPTMPGMPMPAQQKPVTPPHQHGTPAKKTTETAPKTEDMSGMDMKDHDHAHDKNAPMDKMNGMQMEPMPGMHMDDSDAQAPVKPSVTHSTMTLQEPEDPSRRTGSNHPAPELLKDVAGRPAKSLADFLGMADRTNPTIAQATSLVRRSAAQATQAGLYPNPTVGYQGEQIRGGSYGGGQSGGFVQQTVVLGGKLALRRDIYEQQKRSDEINVEEQTLRVHSDVTQAFYSALTAQALVNVRRRLLGLTLDAVETVHQLANVGQADAPDILQTEVESEQAKVDFVRAQRAFLQEYRMLAALAGQKDMVVSPLEGDLEHPPIIDAEQQVTMLVANSPEVRRAQQEVTVAEARLKNARRESIPDLQLKVGEQYNGQLVSDNPNRPTGAQSFATAAMNIPLWNRNQGNKRAAGVEVERARQDVQRTQLNLQREAAPLAQSYETARFESERFRNQLIPRAQRAYELYLTKYENMAQAYPQVLVSQRTLFQLQVSYLQSLHETWQSAIALQNFALTGGLNQPQSRGTSNTSINLPGSGGGAE
ncbi:TolC family protein [Terriglobus tenax]|uniref:TolC family protein n=1 Tax=Terriglobus tenax TaxID=1111115 RepID=UPI0021DF9D1E|nr:TolC family protein [Terriglobus tenax]